MQHFGEVVMIKKDETPIQELMSVCGWVETGDEIQLVEQSRKLIELYWGEITIPVNM